MKDNRLEEGLYLFVYTLLCLLFFQMFPFWNLFELKLKKVDLFSDIRTSVPVVVEKKDTIAIIEQEPAIKHRNKNCPIGITCLEDYSEGRRGLEKFVKGLLKKSSKPIRIAFYGDSFIEGDILTSGFRDTLQRIYGGRGQGFVPIYSEVAKFRNTIHHEFENFQQKNIINKYALEPDFGPSGQMVRALENNHLSFNPPKSQKNLAPSWLIYSSKVLSKFWAKEDSLEKEIILEPTHFIGRTMISKDNLKSLELKFQSEDSVNLHGVIFEGGPGIYVDNLAMRGNSGLALTRISQGLLSQTNSIRPYHLIIFQFGLNVISENDSTDYGWYVAGMSKVIEYFQNSFPESSFILLGISDRSMNSEGEYQTIPAVIRMRNAQRRIAIKTGILFWDTFEAMGGENSMNKLVSAQPPLAGKDHTHLNARGGQWIAGKLAKAILFEINQYENPGGSNN